MNRHFKSSAIFLLATVFIANCISSSAQSTNFTSDLSLGSTGSEVLLLQQVLNMDPDTALASSGAGSAGSETDYFGTITQNAVIRFQNKHASEILTPINLSYGTGIVGSRTREVLNQIYDGGSFATTQIAPTPQANFSSQISTAPIITAVKPGSVSDPRNIPVIIEGENFAANNKVFLSIQNLEIFEAPSYDGRTISVLLDTEIIEGVKEMVDLAAGEAPSAQRLSAINSLKTEFDSIGLDGVYVPAVIFVQNGIGESNKFLIKVNVLKDDM